MGRKSAQGLRICVAVVTWGGLAAGTLALGGTAGPARQLERRIEQQLGAPRTAQPPAPKETHESPPIEPWELVSV